jgi:hypothetical protein
MVHLAQSDIQGTNYDPSGARWSERDGLQRVGGQIHKLVPAEMQSTTQSVKFFAAM